uniref:Uncharacterized protein n=1 Tax=Anguilla anguilla TaxID=7936 RepID=A0A0E9UIR4_ANGAN
MSTCIPKYQIPYISTSVID